MSRGGAPTGKWESFPAHLAAEGPADLRKAQVKLKVRRPGVPAVEISIDKTEFVIGRQPSEVDLVLDDDLVSRRHARLTMDGRGYFKLEDLGSQNGIRYEGRSVRRLNLIDGDTFFIGKTELVFSAVMSRLAAQASKPPTRRDESVAEPPPVPDPAEVGPSLAEDPEDDPDASEEDGE